MDEETARQVEILGLTADSRAVHPGWLFAAVAGHRADGADFIADALKRGAACILAAPSVTLPTVPSPDGGAPAPLLTDPNPRRRLALMAARFHGLQPRNIAAVTGTNGKTSVVSFTRQIWSRLGQRAASLGTLGLDAPDVNVPDVNIGGPALTTPDPVALHEKLADLARHGVDHLAIEASSHGLEQYRLDGVRIGAAGFTNLSRDHLDHHGDMDSYLAAKMRLFSEVMVEGGTAVLNADAPEFDRLRVACGRRHQILSYGAEGADLRLRSAVPDDQGGQALILAIAGRDYHVRLPLVGDFQISNALCALGLVLAQGAPADKAVAALSDLHGAPGRMQAAGRLDNGAAIYIDYAHTPDALAHVLRALRPHTKGHLHVLFGCGGDRDRGKRPQMGAIAHDLADGIIVSDDNPRSEDAAAIRREILIACPQARDIGNRREAIHTAIARLGPGDILVIAGKGHETGQIIGDITHPFHDLDVARAAIAAHRESRA